MKSSEYIKSKIINLVNQNPHIKCSYEFDKDSNVHLIEIEPLSIYNTDQKYFDAESEITFSFIDKFPNENICFVSENSLIKVENPSFIKVGELFSVLSFASISNLNIEQIKSVQKINSFSENNDFNFNFWDERKAKKQVSEQIEYTGNYQFAMAA